MAARASRTENQDAIDTAIVGMLADPKEVNSSISKSLNSFEMAVEMFNCSFHLPFFSRRVLAFRKYISFLSTRQISEQH